MSRVWREEGESKQDEWAFHARSRSGPVCCIFKCGFESMEFVSGTADISLREPRKAGGPPSSPQVGHRMRVLRVRSGSALDAAGGLWAPLLFRTLRCLPRVCLVLRQLLNNKQNSPIRTGPEKKNHMAARSRATVAQALPNPAQCVLLNAATLYVYSQPSRSALHVTARVPPS